MDSRKPAILVVDDEPAIVSSIIRSLEDDYECLGAANAAEARKLFDGREITCILSDQRMPGESGSELLAWVRRTHPDTIRILITGFSDFDSVVAAVNDGQIYHFLHKPWEPIHLEVVIRQAVQMHQLTGENRRLHAELQARNQVLERENLTLKAGTIQEAAAFRDLIGVSAPMQRLKDKLQALLNSQSTVLVTGESGTGKELVARALHFAGSRKDKSFIAQNCAALPESILESELFGHVKGAFTHATENRAGILEGAHGGTLFLDEVGDMSLGMQAKLLRFLQEGTFTPVGGRIEKKVDVRVIAATHRDLEAMVKDKTFREDLYYRLAVVPLRTPALRERRDDIPVLAEHFLRKKAAKFGRPAPRLAPETLARLAAHNYPGNVRELENAIEYALNMVGDRTVVLPEDLPDRIQGAPGPAAPAGTAATAPIAQLPKDLMLDEAVMALEVEWINRAMQASGGNISQSARALGLSRQGLHNKLAKYGIKGDGAADAA
ncbi:MAG: sigma-54-dependent Fis family transcriptional regulator [Fibrobacteres bacterium]|jgi:two-component system response regulator HupR/HoxA|nr:sigma-54-dependent Fis family transcriptional regulator [Fibrobacterota bacterium]